MHHLASRILVGLSSMQMRRKRVGSEIYQQYRRRAILMRSSQFIYATCISLILRIPYSKYRYRVSHYQFWGTGMSFQQLFFSNRVYRYYVFRRQWYMYRCVYLCLYGIYVISILQYQFPMVNRHVPVFCFIGVPRTFKRSITISVTGTMKGRMYGSLADIPVYSYIVVY